MPEIKLENITKKFDRFYSVDNLSLYIPDNSFITLLGPSGCGKTTTLRMIAGLETPTSGRITIGDKVVFDSEAGINVPANKRKVGFLFQNYALWPNMTVYENISFGLRNIKEELPLRDDKAKVCTDIIRVLKDSQRLPKLLVGEHYDDILRKLIDVYDITYWTAIEITKLDIGTDSSASSKCEKLAKEYEEKLDAIMEDHKKNGETLNKNFEIIKNGNLLKEVRCLTEEEIDMAVQSSAKIVKIGMFMNRYPAELSGGQQQRVAIARTLAPKPKVLFMDEPLSNLDAKLRLGMRYELQRLHVTTGATFVYVTHDQMEAMTLATKICLMNNGVLQQYDAPLDVYLKPNNTFTADFVGNPSINFMEAKGKQASDGSIALEILNGKKITFTPKESLSLDKSSSNEKLSLDKWFKERDEAASKVVVIDKQNKDELFKPRIDKAVEDHAEEKKEVTNEDFFIGVRPEYIHINEKGDFEAEVYGAMPTGMESTLKLKLDNFLLTSVVFGSTAFAIGQKVRFDIGGDGILLFDRKSGKRICNGSVK